MSRKKEFILSITRFDYDGRVISFRRESGTKKQLLTLIQHSTDHTNPTKNGIYTHSNDYVGYTSLTWIDKSTRTIGDHS